MVALLVLAMAGAMALVWIVATASGVVAPVAPNGMVLVIAAAGGLALVAAVFFSVVRQMAMPIGSVMDAVDRVAAGEYETRVREAGPPRIRALARSFNTMSERLQNHDRLRRELMADVAHELRTPLTIMQGKLEGLLDDVYPRSDAQLQQLLEETHVLSRLVDDLRTLALSESGILKLQREPTDLVALARDVESAFAGEAAARHVALQVDAPAATMPIDLDPVRIREVMSNLIANALRHTPAGGSVALRVGASASHEVSVEVRDTGSGMTADDLAHAFDRFYKGSQSRGSGLGLTIARNLVIAHGGEIRAASEPGRGTTITFTLPRSPQSPSI
jgi:two-component system sensor histidine kinase BaeS